MSARLLIGLVLLAALIGFGFASVSTYDFAAHLDRQVHNLHCSFIPGMSGSGEGAHGCQVTLMSPCSSMFRKGVWGGVPISLPAMSTFAAIAALAGFILLSKKQDERAAQLTLAGLATIPVLTSIVMGSIAAFELGAACKQCIGIYTGSFLGGVFAWMAVRGRVRVVGATEPESSAKAWLLVVPLSGLLVAGPMAAYVMAMPNFTEFEKGCGTLPNPEDKHGVLVHVKGEGPNPRAAIEVFDPLCPACKAFEDRLHSAGLDKRLDRKLMLFPLDNTCNWMVDSAMHPGACAVSGAVLCAGARAKEVIDWAFAEQPAILAAAATDPSAAARMTQAKFPELKACMESAVTKARIAQGLRWAVKNQLPVLTPQLYVAGKRLCDEDTDLGLEYTLSRMLEAAP